MRMSKEVVVPRCTAVLFGFSRRGVFFRNSFPRARFSFTVVRFRFSSKEVVVPRCTVVLFIFSRRGAFFGVCCLGAEI
jgi:hypothetical protein